MDFETVEQNMEEVYFKVSSDVLNTGIGFAGNGSSNLFAPYVALDDMLSRGEVQEGGRLLDFGIGWGRVMLLASQMGLDVYGADIAKACVDYFGMLFEMARDMEVVGEERVYQVAHASYFPERYVQFKGAGRGINIWSPLTESDGYAIPALSVGRFFDLETDIEGALGTLDGFDIWYSYNWPEQVHYLLEMFSLYSGEEATFLVNSIGQIEGGEVLLEKLGLRGRPMDDGVFPNRDLRNFYKIEKN